MDRFFFFIKDLSQWGFIYSAFYLFSLPVQLEYVQWFSNYALWYILVFVCKHQRISVNRSHHIFFRASGFWNFFSSVTHYTSVCTLSFSHINLLVLCCFDIVFSGLGIPFTLAKISHFKIWFQCPLFWKWSPIQSQGAHHLLSLYSPFKCLCWALIMSFAFLFIIFIIIFNFLAQSINQTELFEDRVSVHTVSPSPVLQSRRSIPIC